MRTGFPRLGVALCGATAALSLLFPWRADAACNPATCDTFDDCGSRECVGVTCQSFFEPAGTVCRPAAGVCDAAETCNGHSLACPSDQKRSAALVCRGATDACDAAEHCDGVSNDCPADVGAVPTIDRVILLDRGLRFGDTLSQTRFLRIELDGANLCTTTIDSDAFFSPIDVGDGTPQTELDANLFYPASEPPFASGDFGFDVNRGGAGGTLPFEAGAPDGFATILSPGTGSTLGGDPAFSISNGCPDCGVVRAEVSDDTTGERVAETPGDYLPPALGTPVVLRLGDDLVGSPPPLPEGFYVFEAEAIDGSILFDASFAGDTSGAQFTFLSGTSVVNKITFSVPEPAVSAADAGALAALLACACARGGVRRRG